MDTAYLDCFSGVSGDMLVGALLDAGLPFQELEENLKSLPLTGYRLERRREGRRHIHGTRFLVTLEDGDAQARTLGDIRTIILQGGFSQWVKEVSLAVFEDLARVEGEIHNLPPEAVHFHEVGAVDAVIDIVSCVFAVERLGLRSVFCSAIPLGSGFVRTHHGPIPVPAPAALALLKEIPVFGSGLAAELVTPTGAALVKRLVTEFGPMPSMAIQHIGYGVGSRDLEDRPNVLRVVLGNRRTRTDEDVVVVLETNLDDASPEWLGFVMDRLFEAGAHDVAFFPVTMKKNRPGIQVQIIADPQFAEPLSEILFRETPTLGIRYAYSLRKILHRDMAEVDSPWGKMQVKQVRDRGGKVILLPEYEACRRTALKHNLPLREIFAWVSGLNQPPR